MSLYRRTNSRFFWFKFMLDGKVYQQSTQTIDRRQAERIEVACRARLLSGSASPRPPAPILEEFAPQFLASVRIRSAGKPLTVQFYESRMRTLLQSPCLAAKKISEIRGLVVERYIAERSKVVAVASVNRELAVLRRVLKIAAEWDLIAAQPKISLLRGERSCSFVLSREMEARYLAEAPPLLADLAVLLLDTGLRIGEALALRWADLDLPSHRESGRGWLQVREGKSANARRIVPLSRRVVERLTKRLGQGRSEWVFPGKTSDQSMTPGQAAYLHSKVCRRQGSGAYPVEFLLYSLRHTCLTRLAESGADTFTIMRWAGHSSATISARYVHPGLETLARAVDRMEESSSSHALATLFATPRVAIALQLPQPTSTTMFTAAG